jgi:2-polyprenyl-3-methyl-5-hydroxy-6-metoxy-1,4-benzoquinol methylase
MKNKFNKDYFTDGIAKGISCYENYRWIPELTYPMAHSFYNFLKLRRNSNVLEYGCANGFLVKCLRDFGVNSYGVDISSYAIENSLPDISNRLSIIRNNNLKNCINKIKFQKKFFDWTISKDVFEHIKQKDLKTIIKQISNISKKLLVIVPLGDNSKYRIKQYHMDKTHIIIKDENWWKRLFNENGFELEKILYRVDGIKDKWYKYHSKGNGFFILNSKNI